MFELEEVKRSKFLSKDYLLPAIIGMIIIFVLFKFTLPQAGQILDARGELKKETGRLENLVKKRVALEKTDKKPLKDIIANIERALPSEKDIVGILFTLTRLQNETGVIISGLKISPGLISTPSASPQGSPSGEVKAKKTSLSSLEFAFSASGEFSTLRNLLDKMQEINPLLEVTSFDFNPTSEGDSSGAMEVVFYYQLPPSSLGKIDTALPILTKKDNAILEEISLFPAYNEIPLSSEEITEATFSGRFNPFE